jgi:hypothetical protein
VQLSAAKIGKFPRRLLQSQEWVGTGYYPSSNSHNACITVHTAVFLYNVIVQNGDHPDGKRQY